MAEINHIGIIVDGNGRWAKKRGLKRSAGHKEGSKVIERLIKYIAKNNITNYLSLYVFSTENFKRDEEEVNYLMNLLVSWFKKIKKETNKYNIKIVFSSHKEYLKKEIVDIIDEVSEETKNNTGLVVNFCLSYGGRCELVDTTKKIIQDILDKKYTIDDITEDTISNNLYQQLPDIDFLIRTSGEERISNFMLWQLSYAEFYFPKIYFPDFNEEELDKAINEYKSRDRRFGKIK
jgi:undecaprenyl diphosphate synthase